MVGLVLDCRVGRRLSVTPVQSDARVVGDVGVIASCIPLR